MAPRLLDVSRSATPDSDDSLNSNSPGLARRRASAPHLNGWRNHPCGVGGEGAARRIDDRIVVVVGVGYVGEHLVSCFSKRFRVYGYDVSPARLDNLRCTTFAHNQRVKLTTDPEIISLASLVCISVPTLLKADGHAIDDSYVRSAVETVEKYISPGATVSMESSVPVGMTRSLLGHLLRKFTSSGRGRYVYVGFSPERVDPGRTDPPPDEIPKVVAGLNEDSLCQMVDFYGKVYTSIVSVSSCEVAEMCKLYENSFRMVNIAYANEMSDACKILGINPFEVVQASATKPFGFMPFYPSVGVGGHCIPVNPYYLFASCDFPLLAAATKRMEERPAALAKEMWGKHKTVGRAFDRVLVVGAAFKPGQSLLAYSPSLTFAKALQELGCEVMMYDPLVPACELAKHSLASLAVHDFKVGVLCDKFDAVAVVMCQKGVDYDVLKQYGRVGGMLETFCK